MPAREALAFDMYSTLVDTLGISALIEQWLPQQGQRVSAIWRQTQLECSFRATLMGRYEDFGQLTRKALDYALAVTENTLAAPNYEALLAEYQRLKPFPDVQPGLERLRAAGYAMVIFSNGSPAMLNALLDSSGLRPYFQDIISAEEVRVYKPSPKIYHHAAKRVGRPTQETRLISANPFDVTGALAAGLQAAWVNRTNAPFDPLGSPPDIVVKTMGELADKLEQRA
jgi:2-haloacid dehalogenase